MDMNDENMIDCKVAICTTHFQGLLSGRCVKDFREAYVYGNLVGNDCLNNSICFIDDGDPWWIGVLIIVVIVSDWRRKLCVDYLLF